MKLLVIACILLLTPFSYGKQLQTEADTDAPSVQVNYGTSAEAISDSPTPASSFDLFDISKPVTYDVPTILENGVTSAEPELSPHSAFGIDKYDVNTVNETKELGSVRNAAYVNISKPVLRKCCEFGQKLTKYGCVVTHNGSLPFDPIVYHSVPRVLAINKTEPVNDIFDLVFGDVCQYGRYRLDPLSEYLDEFYLLDNGSLWLPAIETVLPGSDNFCMESFDEEKIYDGVVVLPLVCFPPPKEALVNDEDLKWILYPLGMLLSVPFLLIILSAYILIPKLHGTIQGKCLMCHVIALTFAYIGLAAIQLSRSALPFDICVSIAYAVQFFFITCFAWLNVLCFHVWMRLRKIPSTYAQSKSAKKKIMILYSAYGTACPVIIIILSLVMDLTPSIPASFIKPQFGIASCWFLTDSAALSYFFLPIGLMIFANLILFILTMINTCEHKRDNSNTITGNKQEELMRTLVNLKRDIKVCFTLFILMGISWTMEIISWSVGNQGNILKSLWYVTDVINSLQGVFIFLIFVLDGGFRQLVKERFKEFFLASDDLHDGYGENEAEESFILMPSVQSNHSP